MVRRDAEQPDSICSGERNQLQPLSSVLCKVQKNALESLENLNLPPAVTGRDQTRKIVAAMSKVRMREEVDGVGRLCSALGKNSGEMFLPYPANGAGRVVLVLCEP